MKHNRFSSEMPLKNYSSNLNTEKDSSTPQMKTKNFARTNMQSNDAGAMSKSPFRGNSFFINFCNNEICGCFLIRKNFY
jgi:hypothetical protein